MQEGNALEVALALMRAPLMRVPLRLRPLPAGMDELMEVAACTNGSVAAAAARTGEPSVLVVEAARFYVREVLLFAGADAYRALGVAATATDAEIKRNYRHLLQWLHPDRTGDGWEAVFAVRINRAWNQLRSPTRRAAYDAQVQLDAEPYAEQPARRVLVNDWQAAPVGQGLVGWRSWAMPLTAIAGCLLLAFLVLRQSDAPLPELNRPAPQALAWEPIAQHGSLAFLPSQPSAAERVERPGPPSAGASPLPAESSTAPPAAALATAPSTSENNAMGSRGSGSGSAETPARARECNEASGQSCGPTQGARRAPPVAVVEGAPPATSANRPQAAAAGVPAPAAAAMPSSPSLTAVPSAATAEPADQNGRLLARYLATPSARAPPIWRNAAAQDAAGVIRARVASEGLRLGPPTWVYAEQSAGMSAPVFQSRHRSAPAKLLRAEWSWHAGMWLVERVELEDLP